MSDTLDAAELDGTPVSSDPGAAWLAPSGPSRYGIASWIAWTHAVDPGLQALRSDLTSAGANAHAILNDVRTLRAVGPAPGAAADQELQAALNACELAANDELKGAGVMFPAGMAHLNNLQTLLPPASASDG